MPLSPELAIRLTQQGHDAIHALDLGLARSSDVEILECARREQRVVVTADLDSPRLPSLKGYLEENSSKGSLEGTCHVKRTSAGEGSNLNNTL